MFPGTIHANVAHIQYLAISLELVVFRYKVGSWISAVLPPWTRTMAGDLVQLESRSIVFVTLDSNPIPRRHIHLLVRLGGYFVPLRFIFNSVIVSNQRFRAYQHLFSIKRIFGKAGLNYHENILSGIPWAQITEADFGRLTEKDLNLLGRMSALEASELDLYPERWHNYQFGQPLSVRKLVLKMAAVRDHRERAIATNQWFTFFSLPMLESLELWTFPEPRRRWKDFPVDEILAMLDCNGKNKLKNLRFQGFSFSDPETYVKLLDGMPLLKTLTVEAYHSRELQDSSCR
ncbi:hypothetical protein C8J56DRAFT_329790 [Mycena floridula]|nr:hypothetical protein C8J56DRAFT_329790 [Mycena floridula]